MIATSTESIKASAKCRIHWNPTLTKKKLKNQFTRKIYLHKLFDSFQIVVNFFVCLVAWVLFNLIINSFSYSWSLLMTTVISFIIMYTIAYGTYFFHLWHEVNQINKKLKKNGE